MPLDPTGKEITIGSIVSYPKTATRAGYGIVTALRPSRARINNAISKSYEALFVIDLTHEEKEILRTRFAEQLAIPHRPFTAKFALIRFYNGNGNNILFSFLKADDGSTSTIRLKASRIMEQINAGLPRADRQRRVHYFAYTRILDDKRVRSVWSFSAFGPRKAARLDIANMEGIVFTRDQMNGMGYTFI